MCQGHICLHRCGSVGLGTIAGLSLRITPLVLVQSRTLGAAADVLALATDSTQRLLCAANFWRSISLAESPEHDDSAVAKHDSRKFLSSAARS